MAGPSNMPGQAPTAGALDWREQRGGAYFGHSGDLMVGMVGRIEGRAGRWFFSVDAVHTRYITTGRGERDSEVEAKAAVELAWREWLAHAGLMAAPPTRDAEVAETTLAASLRRACAMYNDRPLRALRAEDPELDDDGVTVVSDGVGYEPPSLRHMLGWLAAGQWDADGPDPSTGPDGLVRPAHARLASWWRARNAEPAAKD